MGIYLDKEYRPIYISAAVPASGGSVKYGPPVALEAEWIENQMNKNLFQPVSLRHLLQAGATDFCFISPWQEDFCKDAQEEGAPNCKYGGFAYVGPQLGTPARILPAGAPLGEVALSALE